MDPSIPATLGRRVADCRERLRWTQKTLADKASLSVTFVSEIENDRRAPGTEALLAVAEALGASLDYLVKGMVDAPRPRRALVLPPELAEAAEEGRWSVGVASDLLKFRQMVVARRSRGGEVDDGERELSKEDWREIYVAYQRFFGGEKDDAARA
jgi:transcriptional regulator with XRE-family HTH domain